MRPEMLCFLGMVGRFKHTGDKYSRRFRSLYSFRGRVGDFAQVGLDDRGVPWRSVVQVVDIDRRLSLSKLCASFDLESVWHRPTRGAGGGHCYHCLRIGHRFRWVMPPETVVETWGSFMHNLHDDMANASAWRVCARLFLRAAGVRCAGAAADERFVDLIARFFVDELRKRPYISRPTARPLARSGAQASCDAWQWGLGELTLGSDWYGAFDKSAWRATCFPSAFDDETVAALDRSLRRSPLGTPLRDGAGRKLLRGLNPIPGAGHVGSEGRERLQAWLRSEDAATWRSRRDKLYGEGVLDDADLDAEAAPSSSSSSSSSS